MKKPLFIFFFSIFLLSTVSAEGFSPNSLTFNLNVDEEGCQHVTLTTESESLEVRDVWAASSGEDWNIANFDTESGEHELTISHALTEIENGKDAEVCISGSQEGEYHGAAIFRQEQQGNTIIELAVWLKVIIREAQQPENANGNSGTSSNSGGSAANNAPQQKALAPVTQASSNSIQPENTQELSGDANEENNNQENIRGQSAITGNLINVFGANSGSWIAVIVIAGVVGVLASIIYRKKKRSYYGY